MVVDDGDQHQRSNFAAQIRRGHPQDLIRPLQLAMPPLESRPAATPLGKVTLDRVTQRPRPPDRLEPL
jgi:hypothetical protein